MGRRQPSKLIDAIGRPSLTYSLELNPLARRQEERVAFAQVCGALLVSELLPLVSGVFIAATATHPIRIQIETFRFWRRMSLFCGDGGGCTGNGIGDGHFNVQQLGAAFRRPTFIATGRRV